MSSRKSTRKFQAEVNRLLHLVVHSLYSNKEIFLRELISNASDALDKAQLTSLTVPELLGDDEQLRVRIWVDEDANKLFIEDNGIGMSKDELVENLGTVAHSGTLDFLQKVQEKGDAQLIGQFGVGFYSAFLVADHVDVISRAHGEEAWMWSSDAQETYSLEPAAREGRGTTLVLHLKDDAGEFLNTWKLEGLIKKWSDFVRHPILLGRKPYSGEDDDKAEDGKVWNQVNQGKALWRKNPDDVSEEDYAAFYSSVSGDWGKARCHTHFKIEGTQLFTGLLYVPEEAPHDLFLREHRRGVRLYVNRVFILESAEELVPVWLRFVRGVIDSDDLPLNVSREILQDSAIARTIKKQVVKKTLERLGKLKADDRGSYDAFWATFGAVLKEGLHLEPGTKDKERLADLILYRSSKADGWTDLAGYVERMAEGQDAIYYVYGESQAAVAGSPHLEALKKKGFEVLYMTDAIDEWAVEGLRTYQEKKFVSAMAADLDLEADADELARKAEELGDLLGAVKGVLGDRVQDVRLSARLTDSPACLVVPEGGQHAWMERMIKTHDPQAGGSKRILELNGDHPLIRNLHLLATQKPDAAELGEWIELLHDQVLLTEGSPVADPNTTARRMTALLQKASDAALAG